MESTELDVIVFDKQSANDQEIFEMKQKNAVIVRDSVDTHMSSSKVKLIYKNIVDYKWELKPYVGRLVAAHKSGKIIAYTIKAKNHEKIEGMIRIVNVENGKRTLLKGMNNEALDLEFAFLNDPILLAYINESTLYVQKIEENDDQLVASVVLQLDNIMEHTITYDKVTWCPYIPESSFESDVYASQLLTWSRGTTFHCYSVTDITWKYGLGPHKTSDIEEGSLTFKELNTIILDIGFSPDGTTLATCTEDGYVRFYQVYLHSLDGTPRRLHEWIPHDGKPVKKIMFLDNLNESTTDEPLWKNAITYSEEKCEIKLWCCQTWDCLQTVAFRNLIDVPVHLTLALDRTASYMLVSDMYDQQLYVFYIDKFYTENSENQRRKTCIKSVAKFSLASQILSFDIVNASVQEYKCELSDAYLSNDIDEYDDETNNSQCIVLKMFLVQPKSVQECNLFYQTSIKATELRNTVPETKTDLTKDTEKIDKSEHEMILDAESEDESQKLVISQTEKKNEDISGKSSPSREVEKILNDVETYEAFFDTVAERTTNKEKIEAIPDTALETASKNDWTNKGLVSENTDLNVLNLTNLIKQQSKQLNEIKGTMDSLQKKIDLVNDQKNLSTSVLNTRYTSDDQIVNQIEQLIQLSKNEIVNHLNETLRKNSQSISEKLFTQMEHYIASKMKGFAMDVYSQLESKHKSFIDKDHKKSEENKIDINKVIEKSVSTLINTSLIPSFETISKEMMLQFSKSLTIGTQEYTKLFEKHAKLNTSTNEIHQSSEQFLVKSQQNLMKTEEMLKLNFSSLTKEIKLMEGHIAKTIKEQIKAEVQRQFHEQTSAIRSSVLSVVRTQTPVPSSQNLQNNICRLLEQCQINKAFHLALIANDLSLVEFTIKKADFNTVFHPCNLEQTVLLSLIQQLSADMKQHSELKQKYLAEAIINLNLEDSSIKEHAPRIMNELRQNCKNFVKDNPNNYLTSYVKMLILASQSVA